MTRISIYADRVTGFREFPRRWGCREKNSRTWQLIPFCPRALEMTVCAGQAIEYEMWGEMWSFPPLVYRTLFYLVALIWKEYRKMKRSAFMTITLSGIFFSVLGITTGSSAYAATWIATWNDGKNIQYNQTVGGKGLLYMKVKDSKGKHHTYQIAKLKQTFFNNTAICGSVLKNGTGNPGTGGHPITQRATG